MHLHLIFAPFLCFMHLSLTGHCRMHPVMHLLPRPEYICEFAEPFHSARQQTTKSCCWFSAAVCQRQESRLAQPEKRPKQTQTLTLLPSRDTTLQVTTANTHVLFRCKIFSIILSPVMIIDTHRHGAESTSLKSWLATTH